MEKPEAKKIKKGKQVTILPLERYNFIILGIGLVVIIIGYIALGADGVDGAMPLIVAPILLLLGYCVIIPFGIFYKRKPKPIEEAPQV